MSTPRLTLEFCHPGEAYIVIEAVIASYQRVKALANGDEFPALQPYIDGRVASLQLCLADASFLLGADDAHPPGHA